MFDEIGEQVASKLDGDFAFVILGKWLVAELRSDEVMIDQRGSFCSFLLFQRYRSRDFVPAETSDLDVVFN